MNRWYGTTVLGMLGLTLVGCSKDAETDRAVTSRTSAGDSSQSMSGVTADRRGEALVRIANAVPGSSGLVVSADDQRSLTPVDYRAVSAYQPIDKAWSTFRMGGAGTEVAPMETNRELLTDGFRYTMVVMRKPDGPGYRTRIIRDDISPDSSTARVRVIHAAADVGEIDVLNKAGETVFGGINFASEAGYTSLPPQTAELRIVLEGGRRPLQQLAPVALLGGHSYTIIIAGTRTAAQSFWIDDAQLVAAR
jgi:hypothetical protein